MTVNRRFALLALVSALPSGAALAQPQLEPDGTLPPGKSLFALELRTGPAWDANKPAGAQLFFREHSAHLAHLRREGHLLMGARYADKGLVVLMAASEAEARALVEADPSVQARVFAYELHPFAVFYPGSVPGRRRAAPAASAPRP